MSIAIVAMTKEMVIVAADSKMIGQKGSECVPKIFKYNSILVAYGVGNVGIVYGFFEVLDRIKKDMGNRVKYQDMIEAAHSWKQHVETSQEYSGLFGAVGVCGIYYGQPEATTILINAANSVEYQNITKPADNNKELRFYILPPADLTNDTCNSTFIKNCQNIHGLLNQKSLIQVCSNTIRELSGRSSGINDRLQYWSLDVKSLKIEERLIGFSRELFSK